MLDTLATREHGGWRRRLGSLRRRLTVIVGVAALAVSACGTGGGSAGSGSDGTLTIGSITAPNSIDPAKINQSAQWFINVAYDPLIYRTPDGTLEPRLAESWKYVGNGNKIFELALRSGVKFSDGSELTADVVKAHLDYFRETGGAAAPFMKTFESVEVVDTHTLRVNLSQPHPHMPTLFTQNFMIGNVVSGKAVEEPDKLASTTVGAGPYMLDPDRTVTNDRYTYVRNPEYWNPDDVHYDEVVIKVLTNPNSALAALKTEQVDVLRGDYSTADAAESAGMQVRTTPLNIVGLGLADRDGELVPALRDVRVRQALNYAVDRKKITEGIYGERGIPTQQVSLPDREGYNDKDFYSYDPGKAKKLLADAGYTDGFTLPVLSTSYQSFNLVTQAVADDLKKVGVEVELTNSGPDIGEFVEKLTSGKFGAYGLGFGSFQVHLMGPILFLPEASVFNPLGSKDADIESLYKRAARADEAAREGLYQQLTARLTEQAWFLPVGFAPVYYFASPDVAGVEPTADEPIANPVEWKPAK